MQKIKRLSVLPMSRNPSEHGGRVVMNDDSTVTAQYHRGA